MWTFDTSMAFYLQFSVIIRTIPSPPRSNSFLQEEEGKNLQVLKKHDAFKSIAAADFPGLNSLPR